MSVPIVANPPTDELPVGVPRLPGHLPGVLNFNNLEAPLQVTRQTIRIPPMLQSTGLRGYADFKLNLGWQLMDNSTSLALKIRPIKSGVTTGVAEIDRNGGARSIIQQIELRCGEIKPITLLPANIILTDERSSVTSDAAKCYETYTSGIEGGYSVNPISGKIEFDAHHVTHEQLCRFSTSDTSYVFILNLSELLPLFRSEALQVFNVGAFQNVGVYVKFYWTNNVRDVFPYLAHTYTKNATLTQELYDGSPYSPVLPDLDTVGGVTGFEVEANMYVDYLSYAETQMSLLNELYREGFAFDFLHYIYDLKVQSDITPTVKQGYQLGFTNRLLERVRHIQQVISPTTYGGSGLGFSRMAGFLGNSQTLNMLVAEQRIFSGGDITSPSTLRAITETARGAGVLALPGMWYNPATQISPNVASKWDTDEWQAHYRETVNMIGQNGAGTGTGQSTFNYEVLVGAIRTLTDNVTIYHHFFGECRFVMQVANNTMKIVYG